MLLFSNMDLLYSNFIYFHLFSKLYTGGYGAAMCIEALSLINQANGTGYFIPLDKLSLVDRYLLDGCQVMFLIFYSRYLIYFLSLYIQSFLYEFFFSYPAFI